jgi:outer membrane protein OmpA-like peptidoglycan-associated protein
MSNLKMALFAIVAPIGACVTRTHDAPPAVPNGYNFAYVAPQGADIGLVQAFDDGARTYLQFAGVPRNLNVRSQNAERPLAFRADNSYVTLDGVYSNLVVTREKHSTTIRNESADSEAPMAASAPYPSLTQSSATDSAVADPAMADRSLASVGVPESIQTMHSSLRVAELNSEITQLRERIEALQNQLDKARCSERSGIAYFRFTGIVPRLVLQFDDNSAEARLDDDVLAPLGAAARAANRIYLHGHTDAYVASDAGTDLAIRRAVAVRQLLLSQEVAPARVRLFYRGAGNFISNNSTPEGKAMNRRVEIEFRKW